MASDLHFQSLTEIGAALRARRVSSREVTQAVLERIGRLDPQLKSFATVTADLALAQAAEADREIAAGHYRSPLHGVPVAVKDLCFTKGVETFAGMPLRRGFVPDHDATVVTRLREAGAVLLGKLAMTEGASFHHHPEVPVPKNPWREDLWAGVSSSGSGVAPAAGLAFGAIGTDTGGSIRFPSACNGLTGLKPTWGRVSRHGIFALAQSWDTVGPIARSAEDVATLFAAIAGSDVNDPTSLRDAVPDGAGALSGPDSARGLRIGIDRSFCGGIDAEVATRTDAATQAFSDLGAVLHEVAMPDTAPLAAHINALQLIEVAAAHSETYPAQADRYGPWLKAGIELALAVDPRVIGRGLSIREDLRGRMARLFDEIDVLLMPVHAKGTPTRDEIAAEIEAGVDRVMRFTGFANACGIPAVTLPCGPTSDGRPVGFQLIGPHGAEAVLLRAAHAYQCVTDWHARHPPNT